MHHRVKLGCHRGDSNATAVIVMPPPPAGEWVGLGGGGGGGGGQVDGCQVIPGEEKGQWEGEVGHGRLLACHHHNRVESQVIQGEEEVLSCLCNQWDRTCPWGQVVWVLVATWIVCLSWEACSSLVLLAEECWSWS